MERMIEKAKARNDVYELVRLAYAYPQWSQDIDRALDEVAQRLQTKDRIETLFHVLTLPGEPERWASVETAVQQLIAAGPQARERARLGALHAPDEATKVRAIRVLEGSGDGEAAAEVRATLHHPSGAAESPEATPTVATSGAARGWLVFGFVLIAVAIIVIIAGAVNHYRYENRHISTYEAAEIAMGIEPEGFHWGGYLVAMGALLFLAVVCLIIFSAVKTSVKRVARHEELVGAVRLAGGEATSTTPSGSAADEIAKLGSLLKEGLITREEFDAQKKKLLT